MVGRLWHGWTTPEDADAYVAFLESDVFPRIRALEGSRGAYLLRRDEGDEVAFVTLTVFESLDAVKAFAGDDYERAVIEPRARALLSRHDERSQHFELVLS